MSKYRVQFLFITLLIALLSASIIPVAAQSATIVSFTSNLTAVTPDEAESGTKGITLSWQVDNLSATEHLEIQVYVLDAWYNILPDTTTPLPAQGTLEHTVPHTLDFSPPIFRLVVLDNANTIQAIDTLTIPYQQPTGTPQIIFFASETTAVQRADLAAGTVNLPVAWEVVNRPVNSNLIFEQVFTDGSSISVEYPRPFVWVRSMGAGTVHPTLPKDGPITLRLSLIDVTTNAVYTSVDFIVSVESPPQTEQLPIIDSFTVSSSTVHTGERVTLNWSTQHTDSVMILYADGDHSIINVGGTVSPDGTLSDLPASGSTEFQIPEDFQGNSIRFYLIPNLYDFKYNGIGETTLVTILPESYTAAAAFQQYENGYMIWRADTEEIWVFHGQTSGLAEGFALDYYADLPDNSILAMPPVGLVMPRSGFGRVWGNLPHLQDSLGWAIAPEQAYTMTVTLVPPPPNATIYAPGVIFSLPDGRAISRYRWNWTLFP